MSWTEKELKKRTAKAQPSALSPPPSAAADSEHMQELWNRIVDANAALPGELQLLLEQDGPAAAGAEGSRFSAWLRAPDGAALGFAGDAIRYVWPKVNQHKSNNFWIRWDAQRNRYTLHRRVGSVMPPTYTQHTFNARRVERMIKCLVLGKIVQIRTVRKKRWWLF